MSLFRRMLKSKIHRATVTHADLNYEGSVTIPPEILETADIKEYESVSVWNVSNGNRFDTYAISGEEGSSSVSINGAAAHLCKPGDEVIIASFIHMPEAELAGYKAKCIFVDRSNKIREKRDEIAGPKFISTSRTV